jgi:hypothetical protein
MLRCAACRRVLKAPPKVIDGLGYGPVCAAKRHPQQELRPVRMFTIRRKRAKPPSPQLDWITP